MAGIGIGYGRTVYACVYNIMCVCIFIHINLNNCWLSENII